MRTGLLPSLVRRPEAVTWMSSVERLRSHFIIFWLEIAKKGHRIGLARKNHQRYHRAGKRTKREGKGR
jgi:hypothetical protein